MRLLVSVRSEEEARAALAGGAEIIDAKEPSRGALGAVEIGVLREIVRGGERDASRECCARRLGRCAMARQRPRGPPRRPERCS